MKQPQITKKVQVKTCRERVIIVLLAVTVIVALSFLIATRGADTDRDSKLQKTKIEKSEAISQQAEDHTLPKTTEAQSLATPASPTAPNPLPTPAQPGTSTQPSIPTQPTGKTQPATPNQPAITEKQFIIPHFVWVYLDSDIEKESYISRLSLENIKHYAAESKFEIRIVGRNDYGKWLPEDQKNEAQAVLQQVQS